ncbi:hypothetical protein JXQ31_05345 [candidate division KSB1 bacterium]|nr:hypothetical protein [candidate division KSB1 bacterium]
MRVKSLLLVLVILFVFTIMSFAEITRLINYQGIILGTDEKPLPEANYKLTFKLYDEDNKLLWTEVHDPLFISAGLIQVKLGEFTPLELPFDQPYFLGIQVGGDAELEPRMLLTSAAYAFRSDDADKLQGFTVSAEPEPNKLVPLDNTGKFPVSVIPGGAGPAEGVYLKKNAPDTSRATLSHVLLLVSNLGSGDGINARSTDGIGLSARSDNSNGLVGWTGASDKSGVFGFSTDGNGVTGRSDNNDGVFGASVTSYGGFFRSDNDHLDLALGGLIGRINTDPALQNSELILSSNHNISLRLDNDGGENSMLKVLNSGGKNVCTINEDGNLALYNGGNKTIELGTGLDYAEGFDISSRDRIPAGTVLIIDDKNPGKLKISESAYDHKVVGIAAGANGLNSGVRLGAGQFDLDVALAGRVYCNVDASYGSVSPGDLLTTSPTPGYAMVVKDFTQAQGCILGKAMQELVAGQKGQILVLVTLQ